MFPNINKIFDMVFQLLIISCPPSTPNEHLQGVHLTLVLCLHTEAKSGELLLGKGCFPQLRPGQVGLGGFKINEEISLFVFCQKSTGAKEKKIQKLTYRSSLVTTCNSTNKWIGLASHLWPLINTTGHYNITALPCFCSYYFPSQAWWLFANKDEHQLWKYCLDKHQIPNCKLQRNLQSTGTARGEFSPSLWEPKG